MTQRDKKKIEDLEKRFDEYFSDSSHSLTRGQVAHIWKCLFVPMLKSDDKKWEKKIEEKFRKLIDYVECRDFDEDDFAELLPQVDEKGTIWLQELLRKEYIKDLKGFISKELK